MSWEASSRPTNLRNKAIAAHDLLVGERTAEKIKIGIGSASPMDDAQRIEAKGRDLVANVWREEAPCSEISMCGSEKRPACP